MTQLYDPTKPVFKSGLVSEEMRDNMNSIADHHIGPAAPPNVVEGMIWLDTALANDWKLKLRANSVWITIFEKITAIDSLTNPVLPHLATIQSEGFVHTQAGASATWNVQHLLLKQYPTVVTVDGTDTTITPTNIVYTDTENLVITFAAPQSGKAIIQ